MKQQEGTVEPTVKTSSMTNSVQSVYIYGVGTLAVPAIGVGVWYKCGGKNGGEPHKPAPESQQGQQGKAQPLDIFKMH